jgi:hypothetical protein
MLFVAHMIATSVNAGRVAITRTPLAINDPEWVMFAKLGFRQLKWTLFDKEAERLAHVQNIIEPNRRAQAEPGCGSAPPILTKGCPAAAAARG